MTIKLEYGTTTTITITLTSVTDTNARGGAKVDNRTTENIDVHLGGKITTGTSPQANGVINIYVSGSADDDLYDDEYSGTDADHTLGGNARFIHSLVVDTTSNKAYEFGGISVAKAFGGILPEFWGVIIENQTGATLNTTAANHELNYTPINFQQV